MIIQEMIEKMNRLGLFESQYDLSQYWFNKGPSYVSSMKCRKQRPSTEALLMLSRHLEITAEQFSQSEYQSIKDQGEGMKVLAEEVRQEIDERILI